MATERSSSDSDVDLDSQIDRFDDYYFGDNGDDVEETGIVAVGASQPGVAPYRHELVKKSRQSKRVEWNVRWLLVSLLRQLDCMLAFLDLCDETF